MSNITPHDNPLARRNIPPPIGQGLSAQRDPQKAWVDYKVAEHQFEKACLYLTPEPWPDEVEGKAAEIRKKFPDHAQSVLEFFAATSWHNTANAYDTAFLAWAEIQLQERGKTMKDATPSVMKELYASFPDKELLEQREDRAQGLYRIATKGEWKTEKFEKLDALAHHIDLQDRIARHRLPEGESEQRQAELLGALGKVIDGMRLSGHRSELELVYLLRRWTQEKGLTHLVSVELGLPREDMGNEKADLHLIVAGIPYPLQLKTEVNDEYRREHYQQVRAKAAAAIQGTNTQLAVVGSDTLNFAYKNWGEGETKADKAMVTRAKHAVLDPLIELLPPEAAGILATLTERKVSKPKSPEQGKRLTRDFLINRGNIQTLTRIGLLSPADSANPVAIMKAKESLAEALPAISKIVRYQESFLTMDEETAQKIAAALRGSNG